MAEHIARQRAAPTARHRPPPGQWFRNWKSPISDHARKLFVPYYEELAALKRAPELQEPHGLTVTAQH